MMQETGAQGLALVDVLDPINAAANTYTSLGVDMSKFKRVMYEIQLGAATATGTTVDANLQSAAASNFASPHNITGSNITQITNFNNKRITVEVRSDQVHQLNNGDRYCRLRVVVGTNAVFLGATGWGIEPVHRPGGQYDLNSTYVSQRVVTS